MLGIASGLKLFAVLGVVLAGAGAITYVTNAIASGAASKGELKRAAQVAESNHKEVIKLRENDVIISQGTHAKDSRIAELRARLERLRARALPGARCTPGCSVYQEDGK